MSRRIKIIKNDVEYKEALELLEELMYKNPSPETDESVQLTILAVLIEKYESANFPMDVPTAIEAIEFRMDQLGLKPVDLIPYIGTASRVSEILSGKRNLTVEMINNLSKGLGIPAETLLQRSEKHNNSISVSSKTFKQMFKRNYFNGLDLDLDKQSLLTAYFENFKSVPRFLRQSGYRTSPTTDKYALLAWTKKVISEAIKQQLQVDYSPGIVDLDYMRNITHLSIYDNGPIRAKNYLAESGIYLIIEPHLEKTKLDGAIILIDKKHPIIGMTLRMNRLDNFWFTLLHELAHLSLHFELLVKMEYIYDELDTIKGEMLNIMEEEADYLAGEALIPSDKWQVSAARITPNPIAIKILAEELQIHPAIVAGKYRHSSGEWSKLTQFINENKVKEMFEGQ